MIGNRKKMNGSSVGGDGRVYLLFFKQLQSFGKKKISKKKIKMKRKWSENDIEPIERNQHVLVCPFESTMQRFHNASFLYRKVQRILENKVDRRVFYIADDILPVSSCDGYLCSLLLQLSNWNMCGFYGMDSDFSFEFMEKAKELIKQQGPTHPELSFLSSLTQFQDRYLLPDTSISARVDIARIASMLNVSRRHVRIDLFQTFITNELSLNLTVHIADAGQMSREQIDALMITGYSLCALNKNNNNNKVALHVVGKFH